MAKIGKALYAILGVIFVMFLIWGFLSWIEVISHNMEPGYVYNSFNLFVMMIKAAG